MNRVHTQPAAVTDRARATTALRLRAQPRGGEVASVTRHVDLAHMACAFLVSSPCLEEIQEGHRHRHRHLGRTARLALR